MNPLDLLNKLMDNPRTSGGGVIAAVGLWLLTTYGIGPEGDSLIKSVSLFFTMMGLLLIGFGSIDARNAVKKTDMADKPKDDVPTYGDLAKDAPEGPRPLKVEIVDAEGKHQP